MAKRIELKEKLERQYLTDDAMFKKYSQDRTIGVRESKSLILNDLMLNAAQIRRVDFIQNKSYKENSRYFRLACFVEKKVT